MFQVTACTQITYTQIAIGKELRHFHLPVVKLQSFIPTALNLLFCDMHEIICTCHDADASSMLLQKAQDRLPSVSWNTSEKLIGCASFNEMPRTLGPSWGKCPVSWRGCRAAQSTGGHAASVYGEIQSFRAAMAYGW